MILILNVKRKKLQKRSEKETKYPIQTTRGNPQSKGRYEKKTLKEKERGKRKVKNRGVKDER